MKLASCLASAAIAAFALAAFSPPARAATAISVVEEGEGGGAMSLKLDPATVPAGPATFTVRNAAVSENHEMIVVRLTSPDEKVPVVAGKHRVDEKKLKSMGEVGDIKPGATGDLKAKLIPGTYLVFCNIKGHYEAGMEAKLTVTK